MSEPAKQLSSKVLWQGGQGDINVNSPESKPTCFYLILCQRNVTCTFIEDSLPVIQLLNFEFRRHWQDDSDQEK